jgi:hypothetical protein
MADNISPDPFRLRFRTVYSGLDDSEHKDFADIEEPKCLKGNGAKRVRSPVGIIPFHDCAAKLYNRFWLGSTRQWPPDKNAKRNRSNSPSAQFGKASFP